MKIESRIKRILRCATENYTAKETAKTPSNIPRKFYLAYQIFRFLLVLYLTHDFRLKYSKAFMNFILKIPFLYCCTFDVYVKHISHV